LRIFLVGILLLKPLNEKYGKYLEIGEIIGYNEEPI
jgi:hypothetical protein